MRTRLCVAAVTTAFMLLTACSGVGSGSGGAGGATITVADAGRAAAEDASAARPLARGLNEVGFRLFRQAAAETDQDVVLSPLSIGMAFGMAEVGATGATATALADLFAHPTEGDELWAGFNTLEQAVTSSEAPVVRLANHLFPDEGFTMVEGYDDTLARWFGAGSTPLPLKADSEGSRARINGWVAERTEDLIPELVPEGMVNGRSVLLLVNALYLAADWERPFGKYPTEDQPFTRLDGTTVTVPLMHELELAGPAVATDDYAATEVPYEGGELSMLVIVPSEGRYGEVEARLSSELLDAIDRAATPAAVELWLPRYQSTTDMDLAAAFEALGIEDVFGGSGSWEGIAPGITLVSGVHAADIAVDEQGTVAAAATALGFEDSGAGEADVVVRADRSFLYVIRHIESGAVLFVGRVTDPSV